MVFYSNRVGNRKRLDTTSGALKRTHLRVPDHVEQRDNIGPTRKVLENFDFSLDLLLLNGLQHLDHAFLVVDDVNTLEYLRVFASTYQYAHRLMTHE